MKKNGFTLVELLVTIILISLIMAIAVPSSIAIGKRINKKLLNDKLELARNASLAWVEENHSCFVASKPCASSITYVSNNATSFTVKISLGQLAKDNLFNYDNKEKKLIENPIDKSSMNNKTITIVYNIKNKSARSSID